MAPAATMDDVPEPDTSTAFTILKQKVELDFSFFPRRVKGKTTIDIQPQDEHLRYIQLNCRQLDITSVRVGSYNATKSTYHCDLYKRLNLRPGSDIHQHHLVKKRLTDHTDLRELELEITVPPAVKIRRMNPEDATADQVAATTFGGDGENLYTPVKVEIEYVLENPRDGLQFVGVEDGDARYPHAYTRNSPYPGTASCLFPCVDDGNTKCIFDISVRYPRTLGDVYGKSGLAGARANGISLSRSPKADSVMSDVDEDMADLTEEEKTLEMSVICSGELTDDICDPNDPTRKTASFTCAVPVLPQHVGIAVGPFNHVDLSEYRDTQDDERLGSNAIRVHAFCLPGREDEVRNSAMILARTLDSFTEVYQSYPFEKAYKLAFVDDLDYDVAHSASFSICSSRLLFPETIWEPLENTTRILVHAVASQWIGINVTPQRPRDQWIIVGASWFMAELYLRDLFGRNDHRFRQKMNVDKILKLDVRRPSLSILGEYMTVDPGEAEFMALKAPMVLAILHNRLVKQSGRNGVDRCLWRLLFNARNEKLPNGMITTEGFQEICEKVGHQKLGTFFQQWVYGSGCPTFECHPVFNKKKQVIQLTIKQTQADPTLRPEERPLNANDLVREGKEKANGFRPSTEWPAFVGPMTIRIHEADGTPYEHIVDINSSTVKVEIPYNTKYKRLKKSRRDKERLAAAAGLDTTGDTQEDAIIYMLGDLFETREEMQEWRISEWSQEDEARMDQEFYEWIRVDADFEWICRTNINEMPAYMYVSQLQQDKDVMAQAESIQWLALKEGHPLISSILLKTLMDSRYFHGIRTMAANVIASSARKQLDWIGFFHLKKAFQELYCIPGSPMTRSNDFSDRAAYIIQCAIPKAIARIKGADGKAPMFVKRFLLDLIRYNDNRGNEYSDDFYLSTLMLALAQSLTITRTHDTTHRPQLSFQEENEEFEFLKKALEELGRHRRLDEWIPTYQNIYTITGLECALMLMKNQVTPLKPSEFLQYTRRVNADNVRLKAWDCLVQVGMIKNDSVVKYMINEISTDRSPYFRANLLRTFEVALGQVALGDVFKLERIVAPTTSLVIEQEDVLPDRGEEVARRKLEGALRGLRADLSGNETLREALTKALQSTTLSVRDVAEVLEICAMLYTPVNKAMVVFKIPKYWKAEHLGNAVMRFYHSDRYRTKPSKPYGKPEEQPAAAGPPKLQIAPPQAQEAPAAPKPLGLKLKFKTSSATEPKPPTDTLRPAPVVPTPKPAVSPGTTPSAAPTPSIPTVAPSAASHTVPASRLVVPPQPTTTLPPPASKPEPAVSPKPSPPAPNPAPASSTPAAPPAKPATPVIRLSKPTSNTNATTSNKPAKPQNSTVVNHNNAGMSSSSPRPRKVVILRLPPAQLARMRDSPSNNRLTPHASNTATNSIVNGGHKRKAENSPEGAAQRGPKRQASVEPLGSTSAAGGGGGGGGGVNGFSAGGGGSRIVRLRIGRANAEVLRGRGVE
ncbi:uncharacterized protein EI97DRAFT_389820 [Westerdykella ornata]|uniref:Transcription initiation factor TFIID subunit 2 n=1 Tax=Westerdykella ornata TaxID=318751 RepID=A0A6A6JZT3_WESOR|nr:uncharacterized protein EI97DRAFT_389820 [Westerdykella ornata]KAF2281296.1 hypothetical protein EI97DRAFT_389820 [Westerdykella ornata]